MDINVYVLTTGTCTAAPGEFLITPQQVFPQLGQVAHEGILGQILTGKRKREITPWKPFGQKQGREVTGGSTVALIETGRSSDLGNVLIDTGDEADRDTLETSLTKFREYGLAQTVRRSIGNVIVTHAHPDHFYGINRFSEFKCMPDLPQVRKPTAWLIGNNSQALLEHVLADEDNPESPYAAPNGDINGTLVYARDFYRTHREQGITIDRFDTIDDPTSLPLGIEIPKCIKLQGYDGHEKGQLVTLLRPERGGLINLFYIEELEKVDRHTKPHAVLPALIFAGDVIVDKRYLARANSVSPAERRTATYATNFETQPDQRKAQLLQGMEDAMILADIARHNGAALLFGHGKHAEPQYRGV